MSKLALVPVVPWANDAPNANGRPHTDPWAEDKTRTLGLLNSIQAIATERLLDAFNPEAWKQLTPMEQLAYLKYASDITGTSRRMRAADEAAAPIGATAKEQHIGSQLRALAGKLPLPELKVVSDREPVK